MKQGGEDENDGRWDVEGSQQKAKIPRPPVKATARVMETGWQDEDARVALTPFSTHCDAL